MKVLTDHFPTGRPVLHVSRISVNHAEAYIELPVEMWARAELCVRMWESKSVHPDCVSLRAFGKGPR